MSRIRTSLFATALIGLTLAMSSTLYAQCIPALFPVDWLQTQENAGGHTIASHVGRSNLQLTTRLQNQQLDAVGTFPSSGHPYPAAAAQATITARIAVDRIAINNWAAHANLNATRAYNYVAQPLATIGRVATWNNGNPPAPVVNNTCTFRVVVKATGGGNCYILTSYPTDPPPGTNCP